MRDLVLYNAALRLWTADVASSPSEGAEMADEALASDTVDGLFGALRRPVVAAGPTV